MTVWTIPSDRYGIVVQDSGGEMLGGTTILREEADREEMRRELHRLVDELTDYPEDYGDCAGNVTIRPCFPLSSGFE